MPIGLGQAKLIEQREGKWSDDSTKKRAGPFKSVEWRGVTVLTFDKCKGGIPQRSIHPPQSTGEEGLLQELNFFNEKCLLSQTDIHKLSEKYPNVKVTVEHGNQASHEDSKQGSRTPFKPERKTFPPSQPSPTSSIGEENVKPIMMECCKRVGVEGGKLQLDSFGIELEIPPNAIDSKVPQDFSLRVLTDTSNLGNSKEEMSVCCGVQCLAPDDLVLRLPVTYTIPHCAVITQYSSVEAVLYTGEGEYSPDAVVKERIMLSRSGIPSCIITKDVLKLKMNHFSWLDVKFVQNFLSPEKRMCCRPFKEKILALQKTPVILHAHLYNDNRGMSKLVKIEEEEHGFVPAHMELQVLIQAPEDDLEMACYLNEKVVSSDKLMSTNMSKSSICEPFQLDFTDQPDIVAVLLRVGQVERLQVKLLFRLDFSAPRKTEGASSQDPGRHDDFQEKLRAVAKGLAKRSEIDALGTALGFTPDDIQRYLDTNTKHTDESYMGTLSMLRDWRKNQTEATECEALKDVLKNAGQRHLANKLFGSS